LLIDRINGSTIEVTSLRGVLWVANGSDGNIVWATNFNRVNLTIAGEAEDFNSKNDAYRFVNLQLYKFSR